MNEFEQLIDNQLSDHWVKEGFSHRFEGDTIGYVRPEPIRVYTPDFTVTKPDGTLMYLETKGYFRPEHRTKMRHVKRCNPELDIRIIFQKNHYITKRTGFTYCKWAERNKFPCAIGTIPKEWLE